MWICTFICYSTRAVHLELVQDYLTSKTFLAAFERFSLRRGVPSQVFSDNGTNFVGADRELKANFALICDSQLWHSQLALLNVTWRFYPPGGPHHGGLQEASVKSVKHHLKRVLGSFSPTIEEMSTLLCKVEACLNSRPITAITNNPENLQILTRGNFIIGAPLLALPGPNYVDVNLPPLKR